MPFGPPANDPQMPVRDLWHLPQPTISFVTHAEMDSKIEVISANQRADASRMETKLDAAIDAIKQGVDEFKSVRLWLAGVIVTVAVAAVATVIGVYSGNASIMQSVIGAFQAGQQAQPAPAKAAPAKQ